eukprot:811080_1
MCSSITSQGLVLVPALYPIMFPIYDHLHFVSLSLSLSLSLPDVALSYTFHIPAPIFISFSVLCSALSSLFCFCFIFSLTQISSNRKMSRLTCITHASSGIKTCSIWTRSMDHSMTP